MIWVVARGFMRWSCWLPECLNGVTWMFLVSAKVLIHCKKKYLQDLLSQHIFFCQINFNNLFSWVNLLFWVSDDQMNLLHCINSLFPVQSTYNFKATRLLTFFKLNQQYFFTRMFLGCSGWLLGCLYNDLGGC